MSRAPTIVSAVMDPHPVPQQERIRKPDETPQQAVDRVWRNFTSRKRGKPLTVLPQNILAEQLSEVQPKDGILTETATASYESAVAKCKVKVASIVRECRRINQKYRDAHFDLEDHRMCLQGLSLAPDRDKLDAPQSVSRVGDIFTDPKFFIDGISANDVRQGRNGDCWFMAAVAALSGLKDLAEKNCVARDEEVGVYGFVFHRDGEWISEIVDDKLYLTKPNWNDASDDRNLFEGVGRAGLNEAKYRKAFLTGSEALYFAQCREENETWLPLLEKAFAKAHGDYKAIEGGYTGEAIEDLTGGITTELRTADILDKKQFWEELRQCNQQFIFSCGTGIYHGGAHNTEGIIEGHAYSVLRAVEEAGEKLVLLHNPWGESEWNGPWSDGSAEWTPAWMETLNHKFGNDGIFWMSYADLLRKFELFDRTRLFGVEWTSSQVWTSLSIPWKIGYHDTKFCFTLDKDDRVLIALSQLDDRYFRGLEGQYWFTLQFRLQKDDDPDFVVRSNTNYTMNRSVNTELNLEAGSYTVYVKITANRDKDLLAVEDVISRASEEDREKLIQIGMKYDLAHTKREVRETEDELKIKANKEKEKLKKERAAAKKQKQKLKAKQKKAQEKKEEEEKTKETTQEKVTAAESESTSQKGEEAPTITVAADNNKSNVPGQINQHPDADPVESTNLANAENATTISTRRPLDATKTGTEVADSRNEEQPHSAADDDDDDDDDDEDSDGDDKADIVSDAEDDDRPKDPWNAVAVVGLRVFSRAAKVNLRVVTPKAVDEPAVDVDDSAAADAQADVTANTNNTGKGNQEVSAKV